MRDLNFFEPYVLQHQGREKKQRLFMVTAVISVVAVIAFPVFNLVYGYQMKRDIQDMKNTLASAEAKERLQRIEAKQAKLDEIKKILPIVQNSDKEIQKIDILDEQIVQTIVDAIPKDLQFSSFMLSDTQATVSGKARDKSAIAELEYNLRISKYFTDIFVSNIAFKEGIYDFALQFTVKDVN